MTKRKIWILAEKQDELFALAGIARRFDADVYSAVFEGKRPEDCTDSLIKLAMEVNPDVIMAASTKRMRYVLALIGAKLGTRIISDINTIWEDEGKIYVEHFTFGGKVITKERVENGCTVVTVSRVLLSSVEGGVADFELNYNESFSSVEVIDVKPREASPVNLAVAKRVVSIGRGLTRKEDLDIVTNFATAIKAEIGCTRPVAEGQGWLPRERYIGVSGVMLSPDLVITVGLSGQVQHMVGFQGAKTIIAINKDKSAPIFKQCDFGIVGDLYEVLPQITKVLMQ